MAERTVRMKMKIKTDGGPMSVLELSNFLFYFRGAYAVALKYGADTPLEYLGPGELEEIVAKITAQAPGWGLALSAMAKTKMEPWDDLQLLDLGRENPLWIVLAGVPVALAAAVVLSGGKIEVAGVVKAELPPMGVGIASIKNALADRPTPPPAPSPAPSAPSAGPSEAAPPGSALEDRGGTTPTPRVHPAKKRK